MLYAYLVAGTLVTEAQRLVILSALALKGMSQGEFAASVDINRGDINRTIGGKLVVTDRAAEVLNALVSEVHPVRVDRQAA